MPADATPTTNKALVASFFDRVWTRKELDYHHQVLAEDFRLTALWQNTSLGGAGQADREVSLEVIRRWTHGFPDLRISIEEQVGDGDFVANRHRFWGTHANDFMGYAATGIPVVISGNTVMKVTGGKIVAAWSCWDAASFLTQIGALPGDAPRLGEADLGAWRRDRRTSQEDPDAAKALVRRAYRELWSDGALDVADQLLAPGFVGHTPGNHATGGPGGMKRLVRWWRSVLAGLEFRIDAQHAEGGAVATRFTASGVHAAELAGRAATGARVTLTGIAVAHVGGGRITSDWTEFDLLGALRAIDATAGASSGAR